MPGNISKGAFAVRKRRSQKVKEIDGAMYRLCPSCGWKPATSENFDDIRLRNGGACRPCVAAAGRQARADKSRKQGGRKAKGETEPPKVPGSPERIYRQVTKKTPVEMVAMCADCYTKRRVDELDAWIMTIRGYQCENCWYHTHGIVLPRRK